MRTTRAQMQKWDSRMSKLSKPLVPDNENDEEILS